MTTASVHLTDLHNDKAHVGGSFCSKRVLAGFSPRCYSSDEHLRLQQQVS